MNLTTNASQRFLWILVANWENIFLIFALVLIPLILFLIVFMIRNRHQSSHKKTTDHFDELYLNLGGKENIIKASINGSRTKFQLDQLDKCNFEALKLQFKSGIFITGNLVTINCGFDTSDLVHQINNVEKERIQ